MHVGPKFKPFGVPSAELEELRASNKRPLFRSRSIETNLKATYRRAELTLEDIRPFQIAAAWRIVRSHAVAKGQLGTNEPLSGLGDSRAWTTAMPDASPITRGTLAKNLGDVWAGLSLLPSGENAVEFSAAIKLTSKLLDIKRNPRQPMMGNVSTFGFGDHRTVERFFPGAIDIVTHEQQYMSTLAAALVYKGHVALLNDLQATDGFSQAEAVSLIPLVRNFCIQSIEMDVEFDQKMMVARTEAFLQRAQDAADLRGEIQGLKHLAMIQGLARVEPADPMMEFANVVQELSDEERNTEIEEAEFKQIE